MTKLEAIEFVEKFAERFKYKNSAILAEKYPEIDQIQNEYFLNDKDPVWYIDKMMRILKLHIPERHKLC